MTLKDKLAVSLLVCTLSSSVMADNKQRSADDFSGGTDLRGRFNVGSFTRALQGDEIKSSDELYGASWLELSKGNLRGVIATRFVPDVTRGEISATYDVYKIPLKAGTIFTGINGVYRFDGEEDLDSGVHIGFRGPFFLNARVRGIEEGVKDVGVFTSVPVHKYARFVIEAEHDFENETEFVKPELRFDVFKQGSTVLEGRTGYAIGNNRTGAEFGFALRYRF